MPRTQDIEKYRQVLNLSWTSVSCDGRCGTTSILKRNFLVDSRKGCPTDCHNMKCSWFDIRQSHHVAQRVMVYEPNDSMCRYGWVCVYSVGTDVERYNFVYCVYIYYIYIDYFVVTCSKHTNLKRHTKWLQRNSLAAFFCTSNYELIRWLSQPLTQFLSEWRRLPWDTTSCESCQYESSPTNKKSGKYLNSQIPFADQTWQWKIPYKPV